MESPKENCTDAEIKKWALEWNYKLAICGWEIMSYDLTTPQWVLRERAIKDYYDYLNEEKKKETEKAEKAEKEEKDEKEEN